MPREPKSSDRGRARPDAKAAFEAARGEKDPRPIRVLFMGPALAGKTMFLWAFKEIAGQNLAGVRVKPTTEFYNFVRDIDELLPAPEPVTVEDPESPAAKNTVFEDEFGVILGRRTSSVSLPPDLTLVEFDGGLEVKTRDWGGEQIKQFRRHEEGSDEVKKAMAKSLSDVDAVLIFIDAFAKDQTEFRRELRENLEDLNAFAADYLVESVPVAVVTTKFDRSPQFAQLMELVENEQQGVPRFDDGLHEKLASFAKSAVERWAGEVVQAPVGGQNLLELLEELGAQYFPCSAFGSEPSKGLQPALTLEPIRHVIEEAVRRRGEEILVAEELRRAAAAKKKKEQDEAQKREQAHRARLAKEQSERRQEFWSKVVALTWGVVALCAAGAFAMFTVPLWQVSLRSGAGNVVAARDAEWAHLAPLAADWSPVEGIEAGHLLLLTWTAWRDRALDLESAEQLSTAYFERLRQHARRSPWGRQAALAMALGPTDKARAAGTITPAAALQLESALAQRAAESRFAASLDSWARRRVAAERAELLLLALPSNAAVTKLERLLRRTGEPLPVELTGRIFLALARRDLGLLGDWSGLQTVLRRFDEYAAWLIHEVTDFTVAELSQVAANGLEKLAPAALEQALGALAAAKGEFSRRFAAELRGVLAAGSLERLKATFVVDRDSTTAARLAALFGHSWLRSAVRNRDRELFTVAARAAFGDKPQANLLDRLAILALAFEQRVDVAVADAETLTEADFALLFGPLGADARRAYIGRYEELMRGRNAAEHSRGLDRCLHVMDLVREHAPAPRLDAELIGQVGGRQQRVQGELAEQALAQIASGESVEPELVIRVLADEPSPERRRLVNAVVEAAPKLSAELFEQIAARIDFRSPKTTSDRLLRVVVRLNTRAQPESPIRLLTEMLWAVRWKSDAVTLPESIRRRARSRVRTLVSALVRKNNVFLLPELRVVLEDCAQFRHDDPGLLFARNDRPAVGRLLFGGAVAGLGKQGGEAGRSRFVARLRIAVALDPAGGDGRVEALAPVLARVETAAGLRSWFLENEPVIRRHDAGVADAVRRAAAPAFERRAIGLLSATPRPNAAKIDEAAGLLQRAAEYAPQGAARRRELIQKSVAQATAQSELRQTLFELLNRQLEPTLEKALRSALGPIYEQMTLLEIGASRVDKAIDCFEKAVAVDPSGKARRVALLEKEIARRAKDRAYLNSIHEFGDRAGTIEAAVAGAVDRAVAAIAIEGVRSNLRAGRLEAVRQWSGMLLTAAQRTAALAHLQRLKGTALVRGVMPYYCAVDLVTHADYQRWLGGLSASQKGQYRANVRQGVAIGMLRVAAASYVKSLGGKLPTYRQLVALRKLRVETWRDLHGDFHQWVRDVTNLRSGEVIHHYAPYKDGPDRMSEWTSSGTAPGRVAIRVVYDVIPKELQ
ncbi:MAG: hypothetical protein NXI31_05055 [bacterium]|nr:hypothetical protein [bacterium]